MLVLSAVAGVCGLLATWVGLGRLARLSPPGASPSWLLGLVALLPAWILAFLGLLGPLPVSDLDVSRKMSFLLSSGVAVLGVVVSDAVMRRRHESGREHRPAVYWLVGVAALLPAWAIALLALAWIRP